MDKYKFAPGLDGLIISVSITLPSTFLSICFVPEDPWRSSSYCLSIPI